jgi:hypothetical protein
MQSLSQRKVTNSARPNEMPQTNYGIILDLAYAHFSCVSHYFMLELKRGQQRTDSKIAKAIKKVP